MNKLTSTFFLLLAPLVSIPAYAQPEFPNWWKKVSHLQFFNCIENDLCAAVYSKTTLLQDNHNEYVKSHIISYIQTPPFTETKFIVESKLRACFYTICSELGGDIMQILCFDSDMDLIKLRQNPEAQLTYRATDIAISRDEQYLYVTTDQNEMYVYKITPQNTLQLIQTVQTDQLNKNHLILATNFAKHNFLIDLIYDTNYAAQPPIPGTRGGHLRATHHYPSQPGGNQARKIAIYEILPNGKLKLSYEFDYAQLKCARTNRPFIRPLNKSRIAAKELPVVINNQKLYEIKMELYGHNHLITDTFHLNPTTGALTLYKSKKENLKKIDEFHEYSSIECEDENYAWKSNDFYYERFTLPKKWRRKIGPKAIRYLKDKEKQLGLPDIPKDINKLIFEFASGLRPTPQQAPVQPPQ